MKYVSAFFIILFLTACNNESDQTSLLYGKWDLKNVDFHSDSIKNIQESNRKIFFENLNNFKSGFENDSAKFLIFNKDSTVASENQLKDFYWKFDVTTNSILYSSSIDLKKCYPSKILFLDKNKLITKDIFPDIGYAIYTFKKSTSKSWQK